MLSIIVNHYKSPEVLKLCLQYLKKNAPKESELIVADSETIEKTRSMMKYDFPEIKFLEDKNNIGFAKSVNKGIKESSGKYIFILNADVIIPNREVIPELVSLMEEHGDTGILGPKLLNINGEHQPSCFRFYSPKTILARRTPYGKTPWGKKELNRFLINYQGQTPIVSGSDPGGLKPIPVDWIMGSAMLVRRDALRDVGNLSENYFMYMEDVDWCRSFWEKGWKVAYYPKIFAYHYHFRASKKKGALIDLFTNKYARIHLMSAIKYFKKFGLQVPRYGI